MSQHHRLSPWTDFVEVYWHQRGQAYVTPSAGDEINVVVMGNKENLRMSDAAAIFPALWERLKAAQPRASPQSGVTASFVLNSVISERIALVGDASGSVDAITGDGLSLAFRQALALGNALVNNDLTAYRAAHRRLFRAPRIMAALLLTMGQRDWLRQRAICALATHPTGFARLLAVHTGNLSPVALGIREIAGMFWRLLRAGGEIRGAIREGL